MDIDIENLKYDNMYMSDIVRYIKEGTDIPVHKDAHLNNYTLYISGYLGDLYTYEKLRGHLTAEDIKHLMIGAITGNCKCIIINIHKLALLNNVNLRQFIKTFKTTAIKSGNQDYLTFLEGLEPKIYNTNEQNIFLK